MVAGGVVALLLAYSAGHVIGSRSGSRGVLVEGLHTSSIVQVRLLCGDVDGAAEKVELGVRDKLDRLESLAFVSDVGAHLPWAPGRKEEVHEKFRRTIEIQQAGDTRSRALETRLRELEADFFGDAAAEEVGAEE